MAETDNKTCFVIAPIGSPSSETRKRSDQVLRHIIRPAVNPFNYNAIRADEIDEPGIITSQVIQYVIESPLVIADLTEHNPNVFYELAIRHAITKPLVQIIREGDAIPFDVSAMRVVYVDLSNPDSVEEARSQVTEQIKALERDPSRIDTPISVSLDLQRLRRSNNPEERSLAGLIAGTENLSAKLDDVLGTLQSSYVRPRYHYRTVISAITQEYRGRYGFLVVLGAFRDIAPWIYEVGVEAFRKADEGDFTKAGELFESLMHIVRISRPGLPRYLVEIASDFPESFSRLIQSPEVLSPDDLPF